GFHLAVELAIDGAVLLGAPQVLLQAEPVRLGLAAEDVPGVDVLEPGGRATSPRPVVLSPPREPGVRHQTPPHSPFSTSSRTSPSSPLAASTQALVWTSAAFAPVVFSSRRISCSRNSTCFPTGARPRRAVVRAARWPSRRTSSSVTSPRSASDATSCASRPG